MPQELGATTRLSPHLAVLLSAGLAIVVYAGSLGNGFAWDDGYLIVDNPSIHSLSEAPSWFATPWSAGTAVAGSRAQNAMYWRPLTEASYALDWLLGGGRPFAFHLTSVLLHALASALVAGLALAWSRGSAWAALVAGALFAVHPVHTEAVDLATYRTTLLAGNAVLAALLVHERRPRGHLLLVPLIYALGLMSKEDALVLPGLVLVTDLAMGRHREGTRAFLLPYVGLAVTGFAYLAVHASLTGPNALDYFAGATPVETALTMMKVYALDVRLMVFPWPLTPFYDWTILPITDNALDPEVLSGVVLLLLTVTGVALGLHARSRTAVLGCGLFLVALLPYAHLVRFFDAAGERFLYVPSMAACAAAGLGVGWARERGWARGALAVTLVVGAAFAALTVSRHGAFDSTEALLRATVEVYPESFNAHYELANELTKAGRTKEAVSHMRAAHELLPDLEAAGIGVALALVWDDRVGEARAFLAAEVGRLGDRAPVSYRELLARLGR